MANITINLDGNAEQGLEDLDQQLGETVKQVDSLTTSTAKLTEVETQQIKVIHEHHASLTEMVSVSTEVIAKTVGLGVSVAGLYAKQAALAGLQGTVMAGVSGVSGALATQAVRWKLLQEGAEFAGKTVISRVTGMAAPIAAATILLKSYELVMANTGKRTDEFGNTSTNLDRVSTAARGLATDAKAFGFEMAKSLKESAIAAVPLGKEIRSTLTQAWKDFDTVATRTADNNIKSLNNIRAAITGVSTEQREATEKLEAQRAKEKTGFENLRKFNDDLAVSEKARARVAEIASLTTIEALDKEVTAIRNKAAVEAQAGRDNAAQINELKILEAQRIKIIEAEETARKQSLERSLALRKQYDDNYAKSQEAAQWASVKSFKKAYDEEKKILEDFYAFRRGVVNDSRNNAIANGEAEVKNYGAIQKARADQLQGEAKIAAQRKAEGETEAALHNLRLKRIQEDLRAALESAKTEEQINKAQYDAVRKTINENAEFRRQQRAKQVQDEIEDANRSVEVEKEKQAKLKAAREQLAEKAGVKGQDLLNLGKRADVSKILQDQARERAKQKAAADNKDLFNKAQFDSGGDDRKLYDKRIKKAQDDAARQAARDFNKGKTNPNDLAQAQGQAANKVIGGLQQQGKLSADSVTVMQQTVQAAADLQATTDALQRQVADLQKAAGIVANKAQQGRKQAQGGSLQ